MRLAASGQRAMWSSSGTTFEWRKNRSSRDSRRRPRLPSIDCRRRGSISSRDFGLASRELAPGPRLIFELHTLLHAGPRTNPLAPGLQMLQTGIVGEGLATGIDWVDRQIGGGDFAAGQIWRLGKLLVGRAPQIDEAVLVKLDRRIRHLFRHPRAEKEDVQIGRAVVSRGGNRCS